MAEVVVEDEKDVLAALFMQSMWWFYRKTYLSGLSRFSFETVAARLKPCP
jgi:hypothetical protein